MHAYLRPVMDISANLAGFVDSWYDLVQVNRALGGHHIYSRDGQLATVINTCK